MKNKYQLLVRRELWENRALWLAPLIAAGLVILSAAFGSFNLGPDNVSLENSGIDSQIHGPEVAKAGSVAMIGMATFLTGISGLVVFFYLTDCLFSERKDRSILFWKSLPVSDSETVLSKLAVAMLVVPVFVTLLAVALQPILAGIMYLRFEVLRPFFSTELFGGMLSALGRISISSVFAMLWFLPLATYLMLASVLAKRAPLLYAALPPLVLFLTEKILLGGGSNHVGRFVLERGFPWPPRVPHFFGTGARGLEGDGHWWIPFADPKLWLGLVAAAGMLYIIIRLRRYRDDT